MQPEKTVARLAATVRHPVIFHVQLLVRSRVQPQRAQRAVVLPVRVVHLVPVVHLVQHRAQETPSALLVPLAVSPVVVVAAVAQAQPVHSVVAAQRAKHVSRSGRSGQNSNCGKRRHLVA